MVDLGSSPGPLLPNRVDVGQLPNPLNLDFFAYRTDTASWWMRELHEITQVSAWQVTRQPHPCSHTRLLLRFLSGAGALSAKESDPELKTDMETEHKGRACPSQWHDPRDPGGLCSLVAPHTHCSPPSGSLQVSK